MRENDHNKPGKITGASDTRSDVIEKSPPGSRRDRRLPREALLLLGALGLSRLGMLVRSLRVLLGLSRMFFALGVVIAAVSRGCGTMRLCRGLVMFRSRVVCVLHVEFSCWPKNIGDLQKAPQ
jgi:hypothetical protein